MSAPQQQPSPEPTPGTGPTAEATSGAVLSPARDEGSEADGQPALPDADAASDDAASSRRHRDRWGGRGRWGGGGDDLLVQEGDIAGDYLERLLDIVDYDGDIDLDVEGDRAVRRHRRRGAAPIWSAATAPRSTRCRS